MPTLVVINGAPGSGKSTLARRYVDDHPLALSLDIDVVRGMLGDWLATPTEAGLAARAIALSMASTHLAAGHDVVVPQFLARIDFVNELASLAAHMDVSFVEVVLLADVADLQSRVARRSSDATSEVDRDAEILLARSGGSDALGSLQERLSAVVDTRPRTRRLQTAGRAIDDIYRDLEEAVSSALR